MFQFFKKTKAQQGSLVLFCVRQMNVGALCKELSPELFVKVLRGNALVCEKVAHDSHGSIVRIIGEYIILAWKPNDAIARDYEQIAYRLACELANASEGIKSEISIKAPISISMTRGECIYECSGNEFTHVFGAPMTKIVQMSDRYRAGEANVFLIDETMKELWDDCPLEAIGNGVFKIQNATPRQP